MSWNESDRAQTSYALSAFGSNNEAGWHFLLFLHHVVVQDITLCDALFLCRFTDVFRLRAKICNWQTTEQ